MGNFFPSISDQIKSLKQGDRDSWDFVCRLFETGLLGKTRLLLKTSCSRNELVPQDLVQETMMKAWRGRESFRGETTAQFSKWLLTILKNHFIDRCGSIGRDISVVSWPGDLGGANESDDTPSYHAMNDEQEARLHAALSQLESTEQQVIGLRCFDGLKYCEIAEATGSSISTVAGNYRRTIKKLARLMKERN